MSSRKPKRLQPPNDLLAFDERVRQRRVFRLAGVDEAGRGPLAGPVVAAAVILPPGWFFEGIDDSKKLSRAQRQIGYHRLQEDPQIAIGVGAVSSEEIDTINILQATLKAMSLAVENLPQQPDYLLVDGRQHPPFAIPVEAVVRGDSASLSIAAASIIAKEHRDRLMEQYHQQWPEYGFAQHKGYSTEAHRQQIANHGPCPIHRRSFTWS